MDKIIAIIVSIVAVVVIASVVIFGGLAPSIENKSDAVVENINNLDYKDGLK